MELKKNVENSVFISIGLTLSALISIFVFDGSYNWLVRLVCLEDPFISKKIYRGHWDMLLVIFFNTLFFLIHFFNKRKLKSSGEKNHVEYGIVVKILNVISAIFLIITYLFFFVMMIVTSI